MVMVPQERPETAVSALTDETDQILQRAADIADEMSHAFVGTGHLLLALVELADVETRQLLNSHGVTAATARAALFGR